MIGEKKNIHHYIRNIRTMYVNNGHRVRVSSRHLVSARRASISILIIIVIVLRCLRCHGRRRVRIHKATKESLLSRNTADMGVHLIQLSRECIKASIHVLKLRHDHVQSHTSR